MRKQTILIGMLTVVLVLLTTWATCPASDLQGCYHKSKGNLRLITDPDKGCKKSELPVTLNGLLEGEEDINPVPAFEGRVCWLVNIMATDPSVGLENLTLPAEGHVTYVGEGMYRVDVGLIDNTILGSLLPQFMQGTAFYNGEKIILHMNASDDYTPSSLREVGMGQAILDPDTSGTFWVIGKFYNPSGALKDPTMRAGFTDLYYEGTFTAAECSQ